MNIFEKLYALNVNEHIEKKEGLSYLSWSYAWAEIKKNYPDANYEIIKNEKGLPFFESDVGFFVMTKVTIENLTYEMWLPVMDSKNKAMKKQPYSYTTKYGNKTVEAVSTFDINKAIMRCLVKNLAMFGLGLYIYSGEDLPESIEDSQEKNQLTIKDSIEFLEFCELLQTIDADEKDTVAIKDILSNCEKNTCDIARIEKAIDYLSKKYIDPILEGAIND